MRRVKPLGYWFSPDGSKVAFTTYKGTLANTQQNLYDLIVRSSTSGEASVVAADVRMDYGISVSWSPDGEQLAYTTAGPRLDVGSGVGAVTFELLKQGVTTAIGVDLSSAYVAAASGEAARLGRSDSVRFVHADFLDIASDISSADVVTLDRVICCYPEHERLLDESLGHADRCLALSYPRDVWYVRFWVRVENIGRQIRRNAFRTFVDSATAMENRIRRSGFQLVNRSCTRTWCTDVYVRS